MSTRLLFAGPIGPQGCVVDGAVDGPRKMVLNVEVTPRGVDVTFGDGTDEGEGDFFASLQGDGARLMLEACTAYLDRLAASEREPAGACQ
ncbi:hypothetical protein D3C72_809900 [compost metagenome]